MFPLNKSLHAWGTPEFNAVFKQEIEQHHTALLPLQQGLAISSHVMDRPIQLMILNVTEDADHITAKAGVFYTGIIAGCSCADDPTPLVAQNEYCVLRFRIDKQSAQTTVTVVPE